MDFGGFRQMNVKISLVRNRRTKFNTFIHSSTIIHRLKYMNTRRSQAADRSHRAKTPNGYNNT